MGHGQAVQFLEAFPKAQAFNVILLTEEKRAIISRPQCSRALLLKELPGWLSMSAVHLFIRPLMANLIMVDLDNYAGEFETLLALRPRALVRTSPGNFQLWPTLPDSLAAKTAAWATSQLTAALGGDPTSAKVIQQRPSPGKPQRQAWEGPTCGVVGFTCATSVRGHLPAYHVEGFH